MAKLKIGDAAPDFELPGTGGKTYRLSDYRGKKLILAFYPGDFTAVCTKQFCSYRDEGERLAPIGAGRARDRSRPDGGYRLPRTQASTQPRGVGENPRR